jgi:hypothetical protein
MEATEIQCSYCGQKVESETGSCPHCGNVTSEEILQKRQLDIESQDPHRRPPIITVICILKMIGTLVSIFVIFSEEAKLTASWFPAFLTIELLITYVWIWGVWKMRKWGVYTYLAWTFVVEAVLSKIGCWQLSDVVRPAIVLGILFWHIDRMR